MDNITATVQSIINSTSPNACGDVLMKKVVKALPNDYRRNEVIDLLVAARPLCTWRCDLGKCPYSKQSEAAPKAKAKVAKSKKNAKSIVIDLQSLSYVNEMVAAGEVDSFESFVEEAKETAEEWGLGLTNIKVNKAKDVITAKVAFDDMRIVKAWMSRLTPDDLDEADLNLL